MERDSTVYIIILPLNIVTSSIHIHVQFILHKNEQNVYIVIVMIIFFVTKYACSEKISSKQNTLMKWFSKPAKKGTPQKDTRPREEEDNGDCRPANKKQKLES